MKSGNEFVEKYLEFLNGPLAGLNLTRITDPKEFELKQYQDSLNPLNEVKSFKENLQSTGLLLDIGFGGGFPILPIAWANPDINCIGLEARGKKSKAVNQIAEFLHLDNVNTFHKRAEEIFIDIPVVVTFKAVSTIKNCLKTLNTNQQLTVVFYKGPSVFTDEKEEFESIENWSLVEHTVVDIPSTDERNILVFKNVPRGTNLNKLPKNIVKLSKFL